MGKGTVDEIGLIGQARHRAFETYLRFGRMPHASASAESKAIDRAASLPAALPQHPTRFYMWRTAADDRVRHSHAARHGGIFAWSEPPPGGHPGKEANCRCWAAPYYGDPSVPGVLQPLHHQRQVSTDATTPWASIETLTRSDGSLAQSVVVDRDGTTIRSRFEATSIIRMVALADGQTVRVDAEPGLQSVYLGDDSRPLFQSSWTATGPRIVRARQDVAFLLVRGPFNRPNRSSPRETELTGGSSGGGIGGGSGSGGGIGWDFGLGVIARALTATQATLQTAPASQGLGEDDKPIIVLRSWTLD